MNLILIKVFIIKTKKNVYILSGEIMICRLCRKTYVKHLGLLDLFKKEKYFFCPDCSKKYQLKIQTLSIPLDGYRLEVISLYDYIPRELSSYFAYEYGVVAGKIFRLHKILLLADYFNENDVIIYNRIAKLLKSDVILLCYSFHQIS